MVEDTPADVKRKQKKYEEWRNKPDWWHDWTACNVWTASFFVSLAKLDDPAVPTYDRFFRFVDKRDSQPQMAAAANALAERLRFFHWRLEFPQVFEKGGFDVVLGNPPWERPEFHEEHYWLDDPTIYRVRNKAERERRLNDYRRSQASALRQRLEAFEAAKHASEAKSNTGDVRGDSRYQRRANSTFTHSMCNVKRSLIRCLVKN